jgi:flagellar export protein FliJ
MRTFQFKLEQVVRWRRTQAELERSKTALAVAGVSKIQNELESARNKLATSARDLAAGGSGEELETWSAFSRRLSREIAAIGKRLEEAERALGGQMRKMAEADRRLKLVENLRQAARERWTAEHDRALEAFAAEAFLVGYNRESSRARSSGG